MQEVVRCVHLEQELRAGLGLRDLPPAQYCNATFYSIEGYLPLTTSLVVEVSSQKSAGTISCTGSRLGEIT